jgi:hypothetical protein
MFDANLCRVPVGHNIWVKFCGRHSNHGDNSGIIGSVYRCEVIKNTGIDEEMVIAVHKGHLRFKRRFYNDQDTSVVNVSYDDTGDRWVSYDGHLSILDT